ncbi:MAG TPA: thioredoxin-disulfide reductase [Spirochaetota bacterium]|nr:thioredoxin-disulfide reductase [Spirochaetota bacterium]HOL58120.1 thioredoxin-disulfide reductase [Spirochaetota bacterium]HPP05605.1 thioredoxin-disulfide reductase [Spirochaetota bacterium]
MSKLYDIIIVGGGPAGMTAGIYAGRSGYKAAIIEKTGTGGQMMLTDIIDNFPGFPDGITGFELQDKMYRQTKKFGTEIIIDEIIKIRKDNEIFKLESSNNNSYHAISVILSLGAKHKLLNVKGENEFTSKGVSYCATCDGPFFRGKSVAVIGGGDTALTEAIFLSKFCKKVFIVHRRDKFRAVQSLVNSAKRITNIEFVFNSVVEEIQGDNFVKSIKLKDKDNNIKELQVDGVFILIGLEPNTDFIDLPILDENKYIITDERMMTPIKGLFAAGDVRANSFRQIITGCGDGALAFHYAEEYVDEIKGNR